MKRVAMCHASSNLRTWHVVVPAASLNNNNKHTTDLCRVFLCVYAESMSFLRLGRRMNKEPPQSFGGEQTAWSALAMVISRL